MTAKGDNFPAFNSIQEPDSTDTDEKETEEIEELEETTELQEASRNYWENRSHPQAIEMTDSIIEITKSIAEPVVHYNKTHISIETTGRNFIWCYPGKSTRMLVRMRVDDDRDQVVKSLIEQGVECKKGVWPSMARLNLVPKDLEQNKEAITKAIRIAENHSHG